MSRLSSALALLPLAASSLISNATGIYKISNVTALAETEETTCIEGYIMDFYCINRGTLLDKPTLSTLGKPGEHSLHCLLDPSFCYESGMEILGDPTNKDDMHCRAYRLDKDTVDRVIALGRKTGSTQTGCTTCETQENGQRDGFRATITGTVDRSGEMPYMLKATSVKASSEGCGDLPKYDCANATTDMGMNLAPVRFHGTLMMLSWGFLLPLGIIIARRQRHRDPLWFQLHRGIQSLGLLIAVIGVSIALYNFSAFESPNPQSRYHAMFGMLVMLGGICQPIGAFFRPHKHPGEEASFGRQVFERAHKTIGYLITLLALVVVFIGTRIAGPDLGPIFQPTFFVVLALLFVIAACLIYDGKLHASKTEEDAKEAKEEIELQGNREA